MIHLSDLHHARPERYPTLAAAMTAVLARYPEAVFSDVDFAGEPVIWVWPSNAASQHAAPDDAVAWLEQGPPLDTAPPPG